MIRGIEAIKRLSYNNNDVPIVALDLEKAPYSPEEIEAFDNLVPKIFIPQDGMHLLKYIVRSDPEEEGRMYVFPGTMRHSIMDEILKDIAGKEILSAGYVTLNKRYRFIDNYSETLADKLPEGASNHYKMTVLQSKLKPYFICS